ncbi:helix-turn-helix domain-containing protein [Lacibacterium aquatile]|uniref:Helix-turn-helix domain-containing protein n=1 Tax=Lacibacterium aquatile TaxID=1168082 RepID=A0ABW5DR81_9PROT
MQSLDDSRLLVRIGAAVRARRKECGLSQHQLALLSGLDRTFVGGVERGERNLSVITLHQISKALDASITLFLQDK